MANITNADSFVFRLRDLDKIRLKVVGGKGANLAELTRIEGVNVPDGFCVSTKAFKRIVENTPSINRLLDGLSPLKVNDRDKVASLSAEIRKAIESVAIPRNIEEEITAALDSIDNKGAYAVRSSATAEDLPTASFAGQQDTYLNIKGEEAILEHISKCWASLFTERAIIYRIQNGFSHRRVQLSVIVQKMVFADASGVMFTADPLTCHRKVLSIDATFGLGEALVSGLVNADTYKVRNGKVIGKTISTKKLAVLPSNNGGTHSHSIDAPDRSSTLASAGRGHTPLFIGKGIHPHSQALTDEQILRLASIGRKIEEHFGCPQDIEWCLANNTFHIVQSRPITTLFPIPGPKDGENHVYISVGHQQMMTDPMRPLGISLWQLTAGRPMFEAGARLFVDVTKELASPPTRAVIIDMLGKSDPLIKDALTTIIDRGDFVAHSPPASTFRDAHGGISRHDKKHQTASQSDKNTSPAASKPHMAPPGAMYDPRIVSELIRNSEASIEALRQNIEKTSGPDLFDVILDDILKLKKSLTDPQSIGAIMTAINASSWLNEKMSAWLGEKNAADALSQSVPNNITSEMGMTLLDVADAIRPYPEVIDYLEHAVNERFFDEMVKLDGGQEARDAIMVFLNKYGMRCPGEIDITRTRWIENPTTLVPIILNNIKTCDPGGRHRRFEEGRQKALRKEQELLDRLKETQKLSGPGGEQDAGRAIETKQKIDQLRNFIGYREYPKYAMVRHYFLYKQALLKEAAHLVETNIIHEKEDIYYLTFEELREVVRTRQLNYDVVVRRKEDHKLNEKLTPPRVITSDGEIIMGKYQQDGLPAEAIAGLAVSSGIVEGRARVILKMEDANLKDGDILVTRFTDPSWTPLFLSIRGLITEVGGLMTHGAVIAREYGLPAVVGVVNATTLIKDGQRIRLNGTQGYVEIL